MQRLFGCMVVLAVMLGASTVVTLAMRWWVSPGLASVINWGCGS